MDCSERTVAEFIATLEQFRILYLCYDAGGVTRRFGVGCVPSPEGIAFCRILIWKWIYYFSIRADIARLKIWMRSAVFTYTP